MTNTFENLKMTGELKIELINSAGVLVEKRHIPNLVVLSGKVWVAQRMSSNTPTFMSHLGIGTSGTTPNNDQTALLAQIARVAFTSSAQASNTVSYTATFNPGIGTGVLQEAGIFNASSGGTMLARTTYAPLTKEAGDTVTISWTITVN
jgi:hypothetical protein